MNRSAQAQADLTVIRARAGLVRARTGLVNSARGLAKSYGERLRGCNVRNMNPEAESDPELQGTGAVAVGRRRAAANLQYNERIEALARQSYPQVELLQQIKGVGTLIALTFLLTLEDPHRFGKSRDVGGYLGLQPDAEIQAGASHRCTSARKAIRICERFWCKERSTFWVRSVWTAISGAGA